MITPAESPRRIVKKKKHHEGHHGGAWKVAYADFVTAMMALFIVLWIVGQSKAVKDAVAAHFKDPTAIHKGSTSVLQGGAGPGGSIAPVPPISSPEARSTPEAKAERTMLEGAAAALQQKIHHEARFASLEKWIRIEVVDDGLRIHLVEAPQGAFFDVGSAKVNPATHELLGIIAREIGRLPNEIAIEGHTDSRPYTGAPNYSNWELSSDRANAARRILESTGLSAGKIAHVVGYADRQLANRANPHDASNRRISIIVRSRAKPHG
jgi:chemotaxis protein MotB